MSTAQRIQLPQERESLVEVRQGPRLGCRYAYARSADTQSGGDRGQDYLTLLADETHFAFVLCDGVSQSFVGDLAARFLGDALLDWLWTKLNLNQDKSAIVVDLQAYLMQLTARATEQVKTYTLSPDIVPMVKGVLEQKRALGSESTFVAGSVDTATGQLFLAWMGDSRLRLWGEGGEWVDRLDPNTFQTRERWSSRDGPVGELHVARIALKGLLSVVAYSDGLAVLEDRAVPALGEAEVDEVIAATRQNPKSDDVSFVEIWLGQRKPVTPVLPAPTGLKAIPKEGRIVLAWDQVPGIEEYEIRLGDRPGPIVKGARWVVEPDQRPQGSSTVRVRARRGAVGGPWSEAVPLPKPGGEPEGEGAGPEIIAPGTPRDKLKPTQLPWLAIIGAVLVICLAGSAAAALLMGNRLWSLLGTGTATPTVTITSEATRTPTATLTPSPTPTVTASSTLTQTAAPSATELPTSTPVTPTALPTDTPTTPAPTTPAETATPTGSPATTAPVDTATPATTVPLPADAAGVP